MTTESTKRRVAMSDVAQEAGVSLGTVSHVLNQPDRVAEATRRNVQSVIDRLGYVRSENARVLRGRPSRLMAVLVQDLSNPFYVALVRGAEEEARKAGLGVLVCNEARDSTEEARCLSLLAAHQIRGLLLTPADTHTETIGALRAAGMPFVLVDSPAPTPDICSVSIDDATGAYLAMRHLIAQGHKSIAFVSGPDLPQQVTARREGAMRAVAEAADSALTLRDVPVRETTLAAGRDAGGRLFEPARTPSAVFCVNDLLALGVLQALYEAGLNVPRDMALVGYDDIDYAASAAVPLTSVRRPAARMGAAATRLLIAKSADRAADHVHQQTVIRPELVVRSSTLRAERGQDCTRRM